MRSFTPEAKAYFSAMTVAPSFARMVVVNNLIRSLKTAGVWQKLDVLYLLAAHDAQAARLNAVAPSSTFNATAVNSPTFSTDRGYAGNGSTSYLNTNFNPSTAGGNFTQDSAHISFWDRASRAAAGSEEMGLRNAGQTILTEAAARFTGNLAIGRANTSNTPGAFANSTSSGHFIGNRSSSSAIEVYRSGGSLGTASDTSQALQNGTIYIGGVNRIGTGLALASTDQFAAASIGGSLSAQNAIDFYNALQTYMTAVGA